jgi:DNA polymerase I
MAKKNLVIDMYNTFFRSIYVAASQGKKDFLTEDEIFDYWKHICVQSIMSEVKKEDFDRVICAYDMRGGYWRHKIYPAYKGTRKKDRDESEAINFEKFMPIMDQFIQDFKQHFSVFHHIQVKLTEADDIAGVLAKQFSLDGDITKLISTDKDWHQLLQYPGVIIWNPVTRKRIVKTQPKHDLKVKCIMGDGGDNIFAIKPQTGPVRAAKLLDDGTLTRIMEQHYEDPTQLIEEEQEMARKYILNTTLIDFAHIPKDIQSGIFKAYNEVELKRFDVMKCVKWMSVNNMPDLASRFLKNEGQILFTMFNRNKPSSTNSLF